VPLFYITGPTASGKTTIGEALKAKGFEVHDTDADGMRYWADKNTLEPVDPPIKNATEDPKWHNDHIFALAEKPVRSLRERAKDKNIFLVGVTANDMNYKRLFDKIILLSIDEQFQAYRINTRTNHNYGKLPRQFAAAQKWRPIQIEKYQAAGAIEIDASQPIDQVVAQILAETR
jgi:dephospho-CoA kinase